MAGVSEKTNVRKEFKRWLAIPKQKRSQTGIHTQKEFASQYDVHESTLSQWKNDPTFMNGVEHLRRSHLDRELSDIYESLIQNAKEGDPRSIKMAFKMAGRWDEDPEVETAEDESPEDMSDLKLVDTFADLIADGSQVSKPKLMVMMLQSLDSEIPQELLNEIGGESENQEESSEEDTVPEENSVPEEDTVDEEISDEEISDEEVGFDPEDVLHEPDDLSEEEALAEEVEETIDKEEEEEEEDVPTTDQMSMPSGW